MSIESMARSTSQGYRPLTVIVLFAFAVLGNPSAAFAVEVKEQEQVVTPSSTSTLRYHNFKFQANKNYQFTSIVFPDLTRGNSSATSLTVIVQDQYFNPLAYCSVKDISSYTVGVPTSSTIYCTPYNLVNGTTYNITAQSTQSSGTITFPYANTGNIRLETLAEVLIGYPNIEIWSGTSPPPTPTPTATPTATPTPTPTTPPATPTLEPSITPTIQPTPTPSPGVGLPQDTVDIIYSVGALLAFALGIFTYRSLK